MHAHPKSELTSAGVAIELTRPLVLVGLFAGTSAYHLWWLAAPLALASVFASSILVHDLIHDALGLPHRVNEVALTLSALLLVKSGHGLRALHFAHHRHCLEESDVEGSVAHDSLVSLLVRGPMLALTARAEALRAAPRTRRIQLVEGALDAAVLAAGVAAFLWLHSIAAVVYWGAVVLVTVSAPIWGAKIPHMVPWAHPAVRRLARLTGRLTPATASVLLHELHHRFPRLPVSLLPANAALLDTTEPSRCNEAAR